jgi:hypothetical protein
VGNPTANDPLGERIDISNFGQMVEAVVDARIERRLAGRTSKQLDGVPDSVLVHELIARGWAVFKPQLDR